MHTLEQLRSGALIGTRRLNLSCGLRSLPPEVFDLADTLEVLNLSGNQLHSLPHDLPRLHQLKVIFCSDNPFTHLPEVLGDCAALQVVGFKACQIHTVPGAALPPALRWLILTDNAVSLLPPELGQRPALHKLMLAGNQLRELPASLANAQRLELIRLAANQLTQLPGWLTELPRLSWLALAGNPLGWSQPTTPTLRQVSWPELQLGQPLGEGASGQIYQVLQDSDQPALALKLFKGAVTSDGLPEHELAACLAAGQHPALCTPHAELADHPQDRRGLLLPLIDPAYINLAGPPSLETCTRDVYPADLRLAWPTVRQLAQTMAGAVAHLHQQGVMHGDLYAHNILWHPATGEALLGDFGAATCLPSEGGQAHQGLLALEVRAFGCLLQELLERCPAQDSSSCAMDALTRLAESCLQSQPKARPSMAEVVAQLQTV
ncbi:MAG: serine/threonine protein kinase [Comamonadaceae bacterium]|nr:MAG: serine/threonine protein kinase [Comamonadaceae bacterium]